MAFTNFTFADNGTPRYRQLIDAVKGMILRGDLEAGYQMPASRRLATRLGVGRAMVTQAYTHLTAAGFLHTRVGAGSFVAEGLQIGSAKPHSPQNLLTDWGQRAVGTMRADDKKPPPAIDFSLSQALPRHFPYDIWRRLLARYLSTDDTMLARYGSAGGFMPLRVALSDWLGRVRGVRCTPQQVVIVNGMQQAVDIVARLLLTHGERVLVESPGYREAYDVLRVAGAELVPLPVTQAGIDIEALPSQKAKLIFVTPTNQFPRGGSLSPAHRLRLLAWAERHNAYVLEDDYDSELHYNDHAPDALQSLDRSGRVIYLATFSKVLFPALRLAYVVLPPQLIAPFLAAKQLLDRGSPTLTQAAIADFITEGHFARHLRRLRTVYGRNRAALTSALEKHLGGVVTWSQAAAGLHVMVSLPLGMDEGEVVRVSAETKIGIYPASPYYLSQPSPPSILLGFSGLTPAQIEAGVAQLAAVIKA